MNREVEERLVAMYFDNRDFEKNAKQTIETLDQLKKSMNLEDSVKGFDMFDRMKRNAGMEQMQRSANKLKETFGSVGTTLNKAFQIGTGPLRQFENTLGTMRSYISRYLGFDFASKVVNSVESAVRGLTLQPISQGWGQYEAEVDSVRTIMSSTGRSIDDVTKNLDDLRTYADKTVYSLTDMTSNLGKFTNNGVELEKATQAMMGVANAAALAGQGTQQASMAMYNISQAIGVGKMTSIDWKSIENANMATKELKQTFIDVAAAQNNLKKVEKDGVTTYYYEMYTHGREIKDQKKWVEVNYKNFRETLSKGWLTSDTLTTTLAALSGQSIGIDEWAAMGIEDKELIKHLEEMGRKALEAASQVRTFSKMMTTLKDSVASGWSQSFKFVFGNADEATEFWTSISERIGGVLNESADARNKVLKKWKETREVLGTGVRESGSSAHSGGLVEYTIYGRNGREILIDGLKNLMDVFGELGKAVSRAFGDVFGSIGGEDLFAKTQAFEKLTIRLKEWLGTLDDSGSKLNKIYRIVRGVISGFKLWKNMIRNAANSIVKLLIPSADGVLDVLAGLGDFMYELSNLKPEEIIKKIGEKLKQAWEKVKGIFTPRDMFDEFGNYTGTEIPIISWLNKLWQQLGTVGSRIVSDLGLGDFVLWLGNFWNNVTDAWNSFMEAVRTNPIMQEIGRFLSNIWAWIVQTAQDIWGGVIDFFGPNDYGSSDFVDWITNFWEKVSTAWGNIVDNIEENQTFKEVASFLSNIWAWIVDKAGSLAESTVRLFNPEEGGTTFIEWITNFWGNVEEAWRNIVDDITNNDTFKALASFLSNIWGWIVNKAKNLGNNVVTIFSPTDGSSTFIDWVTHFWDNVKIAWNGIVRNIEENETFRSVASFLSNIWGWIVNKAKNLGNNVVKIFNPNEGSTTFIDWITNFWDNVQNAWNGIIDNITTNETFKAIGAFLSNIWGWIVDQAKLAGEGVVRIFNPNEGSSTFVEWISGFWDNVKTAWNKVSSNLQKNETFRAIASFLSNIWGWIVKKAKDLGNGVVAIFEPNEGSNTFIDWITNFWGKVTDAWNGITTAIEEEAKNPKSTLYQIGSFLSNAWLWIVDKAKMSVTTVKNFFTPGENGDDSPFIKFIKNFWEKIESAWNTMTEAIQRSEILHEIGKFLSDTWNWLLDVIAPKASAEGSSEERSASEITAAVAEKFKFWSDITEQVAEETENLGENAEDAAQNTEITESKFQPIITLFEKVGEIFEKIFGALSSFFTEHKDIIIDDVVTFVKGVGTALGGLFDALGKIFTYFGHKLKGEKNMRTIINANGETEEIDADVEALSHIMEAVKTIILEILKLEGINVGAGAVKGIIGRIFGASSIATDIRDIGTGIMMIFGTMAALRIAQVSESDIQMYGKYFLIGSVLLAVIITAMSRLKKSTGDSENEPRAGERIANKAIQAVESVVMLAAAFKLLPEVIKAIGDAKAVSGGADLGMDILMSIVSVLGAMVIAGTAMAGMSWVADKLGKGGLKGLGYALLYVAAGVGVVAGGLAAINYAFEDEGGWEQLAGKVEHAKEAVNGLFGMVEDFGETAGTTIGKFVGGLGKSFLTNLAEGGGAIKKYIFGKELTDADIKAMDMSNEQTQLQMVLDALIRLADLLKSEDIANLKDIFADLSNMSVSGTYGQGINLSNFSSGFAALALTLTNMASDLTKNDSALFKVFDDSSLEEKLYKAFDAIERIIQVTNQLGPETVKILASEDFPNAISQFNEFIKNGSFSGFLQDISDMLELLMTQFNVDYLDANEPKLLRIFNVLEKLSGSIVLAEEALTKLQSLKDKYTRITKRVAVLKDSITYTEKSWYTPVTHGVFGDRYGERTAEYIARTHDDPYVIKQIYERLLNPGGYTQQELNDMYGGLTAEDLVDHYEDQVINPGESLSGVLEEVLSVYDDLLKTFESHTNLIDGSYDRFVEYFGRLADAFGMFSGEEGVGSAKWKENYNAFSKMVNDASFVEKYIENLDKVYSALKDSDIVQDEGVIEFNGVNIVADLFTAIQDALYLGNLPDIDASPIITKIGEGLGLGKDVIAQAMALMIQSGVDQVTVGQEGGSGNVEIPQELIDVFTGKYNPSDMFGNAFGSLLDTDALNKAIAPLLSSLDDPDGPLNQAIGKLEEKMGKTLDLSKFMDESGLMFEDENGVKVNAFKYIETLSNDISESLNAQDPIAFAVTPVFTFTDLTRENLQEQLNGLGLTAPVSLPSVGIDFTAMRTELGMDEIKQKLDAIKLAIDLYGSGNVTATSNLGFHMDGIRNEISGMNLVLDTGVLVGQMLPLIDVGLYNRALTQYRTGTAPRNGAVYVP